MGKKQPYWLVCILLCLYVQFGGVSVKLIVAHLKSHLENDVYFLSTNNTEKLRPNDFQFGYKLVIIIC